MMRLAVVSVLGLIASSAAQGAETITYHYDSKGRLVKVIRTGGPNATATTDYSHDKADNRQNVKTTGAPR